MGYDETMTFRMAPGLALLRVTLLLLLDLAPALPRLLRLALLPLLLRAPALLLLLLLIPARARRRAAPRRTRRPARVAE